MRILRLLVDGFGCLRNREIAFSPGITLLLGENEAGKSTVLRCLAQVLMGKPSQRSLFPEMTPWDGGAYAAAIDVTHHGQQFRLVRRFDENGARAVQLLWLREDGEEEAVTHDGGTVRRWVADAVGTADDRLFYRVYCMAQADLTPLDGFNGLREQLERAAGGAELAASMAVGRIDERLAALRRGVSQPALPQNWGPLKRAETSRLEWEARLREGVRQQQRLGQAREQLDDTRRQLEDGAARIRILTDLLEQDRQRRELTARLTELRITWNGIEEERERLDRRALDRDRLRETLDKTPAVFTDAGALRAQLQEIERASALPANTGWLLVIVGAVLAAIFAGMLHKYSTAAIFFLVGLSLGLPMLLRQYAGLRARARLRGELGTDDIGAIRRRLESVERSRREADVLQMTLETMAKPEALAERRRALALEIAKLEEKLAPFPAALSAEEAARHARELEALQQTAPGLQERERALLREAAVLEETERDLIDVEDGTAFWRQEEARAREEEQVLLLARELLVQAGQQTHQALAVPLAERIAPLFSAMTGGRYTRVNVGDGNRALTFQPVDNAGIPIDVDQLSQGTRDQFILAVRLALGFVMAGQGTPLFLLDDPLLHFDADRRREALSLLAALGDQAQIILATHDERVAEEMPAAQVMRLDAGVPSIPLA